MMTDTHRHQECWLLLPWLANGRLSPVQRVEVEEHVAECAQCARELELQRLMCQALTEPDRITYAPAPSLRKLLDRIDGRAVPTRAARRAVAPSARSAWRPPGLAWAASFVLVVGGAALAATAYRWSQPLYSTRTSAAAVTADVLHIAFVPSLSIGEVGELLQSAGARVVEGPDRMGIFGVAPTRLPAAPQMRALAARLRSDARVRWVEPLAFPSDTQERLPPQP
jgi:anti-sigma factor RsiW